MHLDRAPDVIGVAPPARTEPRDDDLVPLEACAGLDAAEVGRKASVLAWAAAEGLQTPGGLVLPASRFWAALQAAGVHEQARYLAAAALRLDPRHTADLAGNIHAALECSPVAELARVHAEAAFRRLSARPLVARSSSALEDGRNAAFPGVFLSRLDLMSAEALAEAIAACWRSAFSPAAMQYLLRMRTEPIDFSLAVLIQSQVQADWYGLYVSADPVTGTPTPVAEMTREGPDALVGGSAAMTRARQSDDTWTIEPHEPALALALARVSELASRLSARVPGHLDIEFALPSASADPVLLQCRPVTPARASRARRAATTRSDHFVGRPCAPGVATGIALVSGDTAPGHAPRIALVERLTTNDFDLIFQHCGIIAANEVSPLSHAAILCRELGVPLVCGIGADAARLAGSWILLDGRSGVVEVLPRPPAAPDSSRLQEDVLYVADVELALLRLARKGPSVGRSPDRPLEQALARQLGAGRSHILTVPLAPVEVQQLTSITQRRGA